MDAERFESLWWSFELNRALGGRFFRRWGEHPHYLETEEQWFAGLRRLPIVGLQQKDAEAGTLFDWDSVHVELQFAEFFAKQGLQVELVSGRFEGMGQAPDMILGNKEGAVFLEVKRIAHSEAEEEVIEGIEEALEETGQHHLLQIQFGRGITQVGLTAESRRRMLAAADSVVREFNENYSPSLGEETLELTHAIVHLLRVPAGQGRVGPVWGMPYTSPNPQIVCRIERDLKEKAQKRSTWERRYRNSPYLIGIFCDNKMIHGWDIGPLFGWRDRAENIFLQAKELRRINGALIWLVSAERSKQPLFFPNPECTAEPLPQSFDFLSKYAVKGVRNLWST